MAGDARKPEEHDVVRLLRGFPEQGLKAGATGTVVVEYAKYSEGPSTSAYEIEFAGPDGVTLAFITVLESDLEVVWRSE